MIERLSHRNDFRLVESSGQLRRSGPLRARVLLSRGGSTSLCLGFTIGRRFGNAVERNRMRRRLRHCVGEAMTLGPVGTSHVILGATRPALTVPHPELVRHCRAIIEQDPKR